MLVRRQKRELAGNTTPTDPRSQRIREIRNGRPSNAPGLSAHCLSAACPHVRAPGAPRPRWAHHKTVSGGKQPDEKAPGVTYRTTARSRMNRTLKDATVKRYHYESHDQLRTHLQLFLVPTITRVGSRPSEVLHPTNTSYTPGRKNPNASGSTRHITSRDRTPSIAGWGVEPHRDPPQVSTGLSLNAVVIQTPRTDRLGGRYLLKPPCN